MNENDILKQIQTHIEKINTDYAKEEIGVVDAVYDGICTVIGIMNVANGEKVEIKTKNGKTIYGMAMDLKEDETSIIIFGKFEDITEGDTVKTTGEILSTPIGMELLGRVINAIGDPIDTDEPLKVKNFSPIEKIAPGVITRKGVSVPLKTGLKAIDALIPIGRGQRELIIGDRNTGKTTIAIDTIINQKGKNVYCIYCAIGQKNSKIAQLVERLKEKGAMDYTIVINASASDSVTEQYISPYTAVTIGEYFRDNGMDALVIFDDLTKHAWAYRQLSLILKRPSGREAYPGDVFYLHSRLLERAARLKDSYGGGSLSALPIIETQTGDISSYIPTNLISITDGQIFLESDLFFSGIRPAINIGLSVSRVGSNAQEKSMKKVAGSLKLEMAQFRDLAAFSQFGSDLDEETKKVLQKGERLTQILRQKPYSPMSTELEIISILAVTSGNTDLVEIDKISDYENSLHEYMQSLHKDSIKKLESTKDLDDDLKKELIKAISEFSKNYV
jgi:F-type H+-transporting ATPase subunit alpha